MWTATTTTIGIAIAIGIATPIGIATITTTAWRGARPRRYGAMAGAPPSRSAADHGNEKMAPLAGPFSSAMRRRGAGHFILS
jgi:hypothetical protein